MHETIIENGTVVRHTETLQRGTVNGTTTENGSLKHVVTWSNGRTSYIKADNLTQVNA